MLGLTACSASERADDTTHTRLGTSIPDPSAPAKIAGPAPHMLAIGTTVEATIQDVISSRTSKGGERVRAIVSRNVLDATGRIAIPGGAAVVLTITKLTPANQTGSVDGVILLTATSVAVGDTTYAPFASVGVVPHTLAPANATPAGRELTVAPGTPITITLTQPLAISAH